MTAHLQSRAAFPCPSTWRWVFTLRVERVSCNSCVGHFTQTGPDVPDRQSPHVCSAKGSCFLKLLGVEDGLGLPVGRYQGWVCRADGDQAALVSPNIPVVRTRRKEPICSVCQYDLISYSVFSRGSHFPLSSVMHFAVISLKLLSYTFATCYFEFS